MSKAMTFGEFKAAVDTTDFTVNKANVRSAVKRVLLGFNDEADYQFDVEGVQFLLQVFEDRQRTAHRPLTPRSVLNYKQLFLHAAHVVAETPMIVRTKLVFELPGVSR